MTTYQPRAVSYSGLHEGQDKLLMTLTRQRSDSLPEVRKLRQFRREKDLDSELDARSRDENEFLHTEEAKQWKMSRSRQSRPVHKPGMHDLPLTRSDAVVISTEPMGSPTPLKDVASQAQFVPANIPWHNWTRFDYLHGTTTRSHDCFFT